MKIQIIGYSGSGKSTLAKILGEYYNLPILYLDNVHFYGNWQERSVEEQNEIVQEFLRANDSWVIDGNYQSVAPERFTLCDTIIFLDYNRLFCYRSAKKRYKEFKGRKRESCQCVEKFDSEFRRWILKKGRTKKQRDKHERHMNLCLHEKLRFKNRRALNHWLRFNKVID